MVFYLVALLAGYAVGSFPTAYLLVKWRHNTDVRMAGSGNVGTLNSYEVTGSKGVGLAVLLVDVLKGIVAVFLAGIIAGDGYGPSAAGCLGAVLGHNFPVWLGFKGGRGLATAAGGAVMLAWAVLPLWMIFWYVGNKGFGDVNLGNAVATVAVLAGVFLVPSGLLAMILPPTTDLPEFRVFVALLATTILSRLVQPVREYFARRTHES